MTSLQETQLQNLFNDYTSKKAVHETWVTKYNAVKGTQFEGNAKASYDSSKAAMDAALNAYNTYKSDVAAQDKAAFAAANPAVAQAIEIAGINAAATIEVGKTEALSKAETDKIKAANEAADKLYSQKNTQYLIIGGLVIAVLIIGVVVYKKFF